MTSNTGTVRSKDIPVGPGQDANVKDYIYKKAEAKGEAHRRKDGTSCPFV